ncbi:HAD-IIA family hydrolase [Rhizohabitans arisaemae]|uniref:HAD-IIA family hydrolase n=1 Tax=Rhizohabitans arisaemae TaxID=2720610 RepID=UPI0024B1C58D|nr:HAD-IIA family hydrolase [Rhizohabitans arisaemae]
MTGATPSVLADDYDVLLLDLDGVVYLGPAAVPGAVEALAEARRRGTRLAYVTNNASRTPNAIAEHLTSLGVPATAADVVTSAQAAARLVAERVPAGSPVLVLGGMGLRLAVRALGLRPVSTAGESPVAVVQGMTPGMSYGLLAEGALAIRRGALFVAANVDATMPTGRGELPGNGALVQAMRTATGADPLIAGKPRLPLHRETILRTGARRPLVIGDRLDTDVEGANNAAVDSLLVLTGVARPIDALCAPPRWRPTFIGADLAALLTPQPAVTSADGVWRGGGWEARWSDGALALTGLGDPIAGLRTACAATYAAVGDGRADEGAVKSALATLNLPV